MISSSPPLSTATATGRMSDRRQSATVRETSIARQLSAGARPATAVDQPAYAVAAAAAAAAAAGTSSAAN